MRVYALTARRPRGGPRPSSRNRLTGGSAARRSPRSSRTSSSRASSGNHAAGGAPGGGGGDGRRNPPERRAPQRGRRREGDDAESAPLSDLPARPRPSTRDHAQEVASVSHRRGDFRDSGDKGVLARAGAVCAVAFAAPPPSAAVEDKLAKAPRLSIAVLPFANLSGDPEQDYFADGLTDDLTTDLSHLPGSFVIAHSTASTYKGKAVDAKQLGANSACATLWKAACGGSARRSRSTRS